MSYQVKDMSMAPKGKKKIKWVQRHMPVLEHIKKEFQKLPKERMLVVFCELGTRSYEVACFLKGKGYREVYFLEGGLEANSWWTGENS